jgi:hypothetical protein
MGDLIRLLDINPDLDSRAKFKPCSSNNRVQIRNVLTSGHAHAVISRETMGWATLAPRSQA